MRVLYFAGLRDLVGTSEEELTLPEGVRTLADFVPALLRARPALEGRLTGVRFAINENFADPDDPLAQNDVIALIPPVAGG
jgi:molybdopterin converting factor subunit 1